MMTIEEAKEQFSLQTVETSKNDNIMRVCWRLYKSFDQKYRIILLRLNNRYDWDNIKPGSVIYYFSKSVADNIKL